MKTAKELVQKFLKSKGIPSSENQIGLMFHVNDNDFLLWDDPEDPYFLRLTMPGIFDVTEENYAEAILATNETNWNMKVVKAVIYEFDDESDNNASVWICFEQLLDTTPEIEDIIPRAIHMMTTACDCFFKYMSSDED